MGDVGTCSFFSEEKKEPKKSRLCLLSDNYLSSNVFGRAIYGRMPRILALFGSPRASGISFINVCGSRIL